MAVAVEHLKLSASHRGQPQVPEGFIIEPTYELLRGLRQGQPIELLVVRSPSGSTRVRAVYGTFRSLGLSPRPEARSQIRVDRFTTPSMIHRIRHNVAIRPLEWDPVDDVRLQPYTTSGGDSARLGLPQGSEVRVEAHEGSFSLVWPTDLTSSKVLGVLGSVSAAGTSVIVVTRDGKRHRPSLGKAARTIQSMGDRVGLVRVNTPSLVLAWRIASV